MTTKAQDSGIRNVLLTGKISELFPWLEPKSSDFALELFINPSSRKAEETPCDHSLRKTSRRVCRLQVAVLGRSNSLVLCGATTCQRTLSHNCSSQGTGSQLAMVRELLQPHGSLINVEKISKGRNGEETT